MRAKGRSNSERAVALLYNLSVDYGSQTHALHVLDRVGLVTVEQADGRPARITVILICSHRLRDVSNRIFGGRVKAFNMANVACGVLNPLSVRRWLVDQRTLALSLPMHGVISVVRAATYR